MHLYMTVILEAESSDCYQLVELRKIGTAVTKRNGGCWTSTGSTNKIPIHSYM